MHLWPFKLLLLLVISLVGSSVLGSEKSGYPVSEKKTCHGNCNCCHATIVEQWQPSYHSKALESGVLGQFELFEEETIRDCLSCHSPSSVDLKELSLTTLVGNEAIGCETCHYNVTPEHRSPDNQNKQLNPVGHEICIKCHQFGDEGIFVNGKPLENTYVEWKNSIYYENNINCITCHLPAGEHKFRGIHDPDMVRSGLSVKVTKDKTLINIELQNKGAGHALPTYITPRIRVHWLANNGEITPIATLQRNMSWDDQNGWSENYDTRLLPLEKQSFQFEPVQETEGKIEVWVDPDADYYERVYPAILEALRDNDATKRSISMIQEASLKTGKSSYLLYSYQCGKNDGDCR